MFVIVKHSRSNLMFAAKAMSLPLMWSPVRSPALPANIMLGKGIVTDRAKHFIIAMQKLLLKKIIVQANVYCYGEKVLFHWSLCYKTLQIHDVGKMGKINSKLVGFRQSLFTSSNKHTILLQYSYTVNLLCTKTGQILS